MDITIVRRPIGEAPDWVRDAWIGLSMPLAAKRQRMWRTLGVMSGPSNALAQVFALVRGKSIKIDGFAVLAKVAVARLESDQPQAAQWWRENAPDLLKGSRCFVFDADACEVITERE